MRRTSHAIDSFHAEDDSHIVVRLETIRRIIEDKFVAAGEILNQSLSGIDDLVQSLDRFAKTFDQHIVAATKADLTVASAKLCTLPVCHSRHVDHINELSRSRGKLGRQVSAMRCYLAFLGAFSRNAKLVADAAPKSGFADLARNIRACVAESTSELATLEAELSELQRGLESASTQGEILGRQIAELVPAVPDDLVAAAKFVAGHYTAVAATTGQVSAIARDIQARVIRILAALQFGDITRQRIEHILACLIRIEADSAFVEQHIRQRFRATCYSLIALQLAEVNADFDREIAEIEKNMVEMAVDAKALLKLHDITFDRDGGKSRGFLHVLAARIDAALKLVGTIEAADHSATKTSRATVDAVHKLERRIHRIQSLHHDMRITAPNLDDPADERLVEVTGDIREHARLLEEAAKVGLETLDKLLYLANSVIGAGRHSFSDNKAASAAAAALTIAARRIREARDTTETDIVEVVAQGDAVAHILALSGQKLCLRREIGDILSLAATDAARQADGAYQCGEELPEALITTLIGFSTTYTMAPERTLHMAFLMSLAIPLGEQTLIADELDAELF
jgi:hypothetical protein